MNKFETILFSIIFVIHNIKASCLSLANISNENDCFKESNNTSYCCYISNGTANSIPQPNQCYSMQISEYYNQQNILIDNTLYNIDCNAYMNININNCGENIPTKANDCQRYSLSNNSCCFYSYGYVSNCFWYGSKYSNETSQGLLTIICEANETRLNKYLIILIIIFIILA